MNEMVVKWVPWGVLFLLIFALTVLIHKHFENKNVMANIIKKYRDSVDNRIFHEAEFVTRYGAIENHSLIYKLDRMILTSGLKNYCRGLNGEAFLIGMLIAAFGGFIEGCALFGNVLIGIFLTVAQPVVLYVIVLAFSGKTYNAIEDSTALFISILSNHAKGSSDIVTIMENTLPSLSGPIRAVVEGFITDAECTGNVDIAFDHMKESVDNRQLQTIIVNLKNCSHYQANYEEVLVQMMGQVAAGLSAREDRKNILFSSKITLVGISILAAVIVLLIGAGLEIDVVGSLTGNMFGQILLLITGLLYLMVGMKMFRTDK